MIKIINEIDGKKYELVPSDKGCIECDLEKMCYGVEDKKNVVWDITLPCSRLFGVWKESEVKNDTETAN